MISILKFPFQFDAARLKDDLRNFAAGDWTPHFNTQYYEGDWSGIALRAAKDANVELYPDPTATVYENTKMLQRCRYVPQVLSRFECEIESARLLRLSAGSNIREHRDYKLGYEDGFVRIHVPVQTNAKVEFYLDDRLLQMREGEAWYLNFNLKHRVTNDSAEDRVHLVVDCVLNDWLKAFFPPDADG